MIQKLRTCLEALASNADILPASGGAMQQLLQPDQEEKEDQALQPDGFIELFAEKPAPARMNQYISCPPIPRGEDHRFRYFFDGALRTYYICSASEHDVSEPVIIAELGAVALFREANGDLRPADRAYKLMLLTNFNRFSDSFQTAVEKACRDSGIEAVNTASEDIPFAKKVSDSALRCQGVARWQMRQLEMDLLDNLDAGQHWMIVDGSVAISTSRLAKLRGKSVIGVAKSFAKTPKFKIGSGKAAISMLKLLAELPPGNRTPVYATSEGRVGFWYVRLWEQGAVDYPLMGVVKCDMILPEKETVIDSELVNQLSRCLVAERTVTPYGSDSRWHSHLYPIYVAEQIIRSRFLPTEMQREWLTREWARILRRTA